MPSRHILTNEKCFKKKNIIKLFYDTCSIVPDQEFNCQHTWVGLRTFDLLTFTEVYDSIHRIEIVTLMKGL